MFFSNTHWTQLTVPFYSILFETSICQNSIGVLCPVTHFCVVFEVCVWIIVRLEDPNMAHYKIYNRVSHLLIFYLLVFDRIHDAMCLNKMSRTSSRNIGPQHKNTALYTWGTFYHCVHQTHLECLLLKS